MGTFNNSTMVSVAPTITAGAYSAGDVIGGLLTCTVGTTVTGNVLVRRVVIGDADNEKAAMDLWFFKSSPATSLADNAAFSTISDADIRDACQAHVAIAASDYTTAGSNALGEKVIDNGGRTIEVTNGVFYVYAVVSGTPTYGATTDLRFTFEVWPD